MPTEDTDVYQQPTIPVRGRGHRPQRLVAALALGLGLLPLASRAGCQLQTLELPVRMVGMRAVATVGINGTPVPLTVDSGAFFSMLTDAAAAQLKLPLTHPFGLRVDGLTGSVDTATTRVDKLQLFKGEIPRVEFIVGGNEPGAGTMGLMGRNLLSFTDTEYDLPHGMIRFHFPNDECRRSTMAYWAGTTPVTEAGLMRGSRGGKVPAIRVEAKLNGTDVVALLDSGATTTVTTGAARRAGVTGAALKPAGSMYGAGRGTLPIFSASFDKFEIGGEAISPTRLSVADLQLDEADMLLGIDFFLSHRLYVSKQQSKVFFTYVGGPVFSLDPPMAAASAVQAADPSASDASTAEAPTADALARRAAASASRNDFASALADLDRACEMEPDSASFLAQRGTVLEAMRRPAQALENFDKALALDPALADPRLRRAWLRFAAREPGAALADLHQLDAALAPQAQMRLSMGELYLRLNQPTQALPQFDQWLSAHPHESRRDVALNLRCRVRLRLGGQLREALDDCDEAIDAQGSNPAYLENRGWVYLRLGKEDRALADFEKSLTARPGNAFALYGHALAKLRAGDAAQAAIDLATARGADAEIDRKVVAAGLATEAVPRPAASASAPG